MRKLLLGTAVLALAASGSAFAADISKPVYKAPPAVAPVLYSWTGCYIGANGGGKWARESGSVSPVPITAGGLTITGFAIPLDDTASTWLAGGQVGCNYQAGQFVFGIEGDIDAQRWSTSRIVRVGDIPAGVSQLFVPGDGFSIRSRWEASVRGRIGYAWDRLLIYATGGVGFTNVQVNSNFIPVTVGAIAFPGTFVSDSETFAGPTVGAGVEYAIWQNLSLGVEGRYTWYGSHTFNNGQVAAIAIPTVPPTFFFTSVSTPLSLNTWEVTARLNWKFDWWPGAAGGPVPARY
jgi:outer membrane immunogenic protein